MRAEFSMRARIHTDQRDPQQERTDDQPTITGPHTGYDATVAATIPSTATSTAAGPPATRPSNDRAARTAARAARRPSDSSAPTTPPTPTTSALSAPLRLASRRRRWTPATTSRRGRLSPTRSGPCATLDGPGCVATYWQVADAVAADTYTLRVALADLADAGAVRPAAVLWRPDRVDGDGPPVSSSVDAGAGE